MKSPRIVFFGTPGFAAQVLEYLAAHQVEIVAVVTQPDRPKGRSSALIQSPVKDVAQKLCPNVPIWQPLKCSNPQFLEDLVALQADLFVVVAFGQILPQKLLAIPPLGCINVHASLLPKYRGAAPIQRAILNGERETGIAIQKMVKELDAGDVIDTAKIEVPDDMTYGELEAALCDLSKPLLLDVLHRYAFAVPPAAPQNVAHVTYAPKIEPEEGEIRWDRPAHSVHCLIRAFNPRPGAWMWAWVNGEKKRVKVWRSQVSHLTGDIGELLSKKELIVGCGEGALHIVEVQPEGKSRMSASDWLRGVRDLQVKD